MNRSQYSHRLSRVMLDAIHHVNIGKCARPDNLRSRRQTTVFAYSEIKALENKFDRLLDKYEIEGIPISRSNFSDAADELVCLPFLKLKLTPMHFNIF